MSSSALNYKGAVAQPLIDRKSTRSGPRPLPRRLYRADVGHQIRLRAPVECANPSANPANPQATVLRPSEPRLADKGQDIMLTKPPGVARSAPVRTGEETGQAGTAVLALAVGVAQPLLRPAPVAAQSNDHRAARPSAPMVSAPPAPRQHCPLINCLPRFSAESGHLHRRRSAMRL